MIGFVVRRALTAIPILLLSTIIVFGLVSFGGDPLAELRQRPFVSQHTIRQLEEEYHLDEPVVVQYVLWLRDFVQGDWGTSYGNGRPVADLIGRALPNTLILVAAATVVSVLAALVVGAVSAVRQYSLFDRAASGFSYFGLSMPVFWFGLVLQLVAVILLQEHLGIRLFFVQGKHSPGREGDLLDLIRHMALPVLTLSLTLVAGWSRFQRDSMLGVLHSSYVRTARAKGVANGKIVLSHALRNALLPFVTIAAIDLAALVGGAVVVERIFSWPGMGSLFVGAVRRDDYPVVLSWLALTSVAVVVANLVADLLHGYLDPRIGHGR